MRILQKITILFLTTCLWISCSDDDAKTSSATSCSTVCSYTLASGENAGTIPANIEGTYNLVYDFAEPNSPFTNGTKGEFTFANNELTVAIEGEECITIKNPVDIGFGNFHFTDTCRDDLVYNVSLNTDGSFNEINIQPIGTGFYGQFKQ